MTAIDAEQRKWPVLEIVGIALCGIGLWLALAFVGVSYSEKQIAKEKQEVLARMDEMKGALTAAKIPEEQIPGLLRVHKSALVSETTQRHFIILSFFVLLSLLIASTGLTIVLWAKLRALTERMRVDARATA
jgi:hypothetical protein